ncbi:multicystatin-like isoform X2 [Nicotiana tabacum]|uniref:Multicystatin-like isoform X2 n=1 Tax=Nicotiana tabacum TaxID=4097 RepID=A0AC58SNV2_TOBAC|nr:multicystatin-like isoform X2 [Nicotiana tomentosiformis]
MSLILILITIMVCMSTVAVCPGNFGRNIIGRWMRASVVAPINPQWGFENIPRYTELSHMAIDDFNSQNNKRYEFVKNLTVNTSLAAGFWCRITFQARDADAASDAVKTFQTLAWWGIDGDKEIIFCRLKNQSSGEGGERPPDSNVDVKATQ